MIDLYKIRIFSTLMVGLVTSLTSRAHHGFGTFAMNEDIQLSGVVTSLDFVNPHSWLNFETIQEDGSLVEYSCEMRSAMTLRRSGWTPKMFPPGTRISIEGSPDRIDSRACYVSTITIDDAMSLDRYSQLIGAEVDIERAGRLDNGKPNLAGDWAAEQRVMTDPRGRDGALVPLSQANDYGIGGVPEGGMAIPGGRGTLQAEIFGDPNGPRSQDLLSPVDLTVAGEAAFQRLREIPTLERSCDPGSIVSDWDIVGTDPVNRITQNDDLVTIAYGVHGRVRTVDMRRTVHPIDIEPSWTGHSIGWWEDDVLVVDTIGFEPGVLVRPRPRAAAVPHSDQLHVVERFSIDEGTFTLKREFVADDPAFLSEIYTGSTEMMVSNVPYASESCEDFTPRL